MKTTILALGILLLVTVNGCAESSQQQRLVEAGGGSPAPVSIYSVMDPTSLVYSDAAAGATPSDNPWRWTGFLLHPVGVALDYGVNRPIYSLTSQFPSIFGYTSEDAMLDVQRR